MSQPTLFVLNGPNLDLLGVREPAVYGTTTLADLQAMCRTEADAAGLALRFHQTNAEHELVGWLHEAREGAAGIVLNAAAWSYAGYAILDALKMCDCPIVEVHLSNIHRREESWRALSLMTGAVTGMITGLGPHGYQLAISHIAHLRAG